MPDAPHGKSGSRNTQVGQDLPTSIRLALPGRDVATTDGLLSLTRGSKGIRPFAGFVHLVVHHPEFDGLESNLDRSDLADEPSDIGGDGIAALDDHAAIVETGTSRVVTWDSAAASLLAKAVI